MNDPLDIRLLPRVGLRALVLQAAEKCALSPWLDWSSPPNRFLDGALHKVSK